MTHIVCDFIKNCLFKSSLQLYNNYIYFIAVMSFLPQQKEFKLFYCLKKTCFASIKFEGYKTITMSRSLAI